MSDIVDVPSPIDLRKMDDAEQWAKEASIKRPYRAQFFQYYANQLLKTEPCFRVLELASGPGEIAHALLSKNPQLDYTALDFSNAMHHLAEQRIANLVTPRTQFFLADLKQENWFQVLAPFQYDLIIIHQALHELRHKHHACHFHQMIAKHLLNKQGCYAVCDHLAQPDGNMQNSALYMTDQEHRLAFSQAGFQHVIPALHINGLQLYLAYLSP